MAEEDKKSDKKSLEIQIRELTNLVRELHAKVESLEEEMRPPCKKSACAVCYLCVGCLVCWPCIPCRGCRLCFACRPCKSESD